MSPHSLPATYRRRIGSLRKGFDQAGIDALLVTYPPDQYYLTGAVLEDSAVLVTDRRVFVLTDSRFDEQVSLQAPWASKVLRNDGLPEAAARLVADAGRIRRLGLDEYMALGQYRLLTRKRRPFKLRPTAGLVSAGRAVKDDDEVALIRRAIRAAEAGFLATRRSIKPGVRERDVAAELEYQMRRAGASGPAFEPIVAAGPRASLPHARASDARLKAGQPVLFDWGAKVAGYCSDLTRVVHFGRLPKAIRQIYPVVLEAQQAGIAAVRAGASCRDVDRAARAVIERAGFGERFGHGLGHGIGLDVHEAPRLSFRSDTLLRAGMVVTVEPGIYLPGVGGVRIEDDVLVTPTGRKVLSRLDKSM